jgi:hypothetical protein
MPSLLRTAIAVCIVAYATSTFANAQHLDPAWNPSALVKPAHTPLPEEYIWTANDAAALRTDHAKFNYRTLDKKIEPHYFRTTFELKQPQSNATVYVAGPRAAKVWMNGALVLDATADATSPLPSHVFSASVQAALHPGLNAIAVEAVRGRGIVAASDSLVIQQLSFGETLAVKIAPAAHGLDAPALVLSNGAWRSSTTFSEGWQTPAFDDAAWPRVQSLGPIENRAEFFQWNLDAGLYDWPGYMGMSPSLRTYTVAPVAITHPLHGIPEERSDASLVLVDFGREIAGRLIIESAANNDVKFLASYGESEGEALRSQHYLGRFEIRVPPHGVARGPKSGFRYVFLRFVNGETYASLRYIQAEGIAYPVTYKGSFRSSDPQLNRIWEAGAYTAHLCMQDGVWDAAKRDRGWWAGDLDVAGPTIASVFADSSLLDQTLTRLIPPAGQHVNGIPSYTALWITTLADLYRRSGDHELIANRHGTLLALLARIDEEFDEQGKFLNKGHHWLFVDWSSGLYAFTPEAAEGTELEFARGYREGAWLLEQMGDNANAARYNTRATTLSEKLHHEFANAQGSYGERWQLNAMAVLAGVANANEYPAIWHDSLSQANASTTQTISPYFNAYVLTAMARMNRRAEALAWIRTYWGGMMDEGATSLWEAYDLHWPKDNPHHALVADGRTGYFVSLAHGWSSGPTAWLMDELLGVRAIEPGYSKAVIRPDLAGLEWMEGSVPTPHGLIHVSMHKAPQTRIEIDLPAGVDAELLAPLSHAAAIINVNGKTATFTVEEDGARARIALHGAGHFIVTSRY